MNTETRTRTRMILQCIGEPFEYRSPSHRVAARRVYGICIAAAKRGDIDTVRRWRDLADKWSQPHSQDDCDRAKARHELAIQLRALCHGYDAALMATNRAMAGLYGGAK